MSDGIQRLTGERWVDIVVGCLCALLLAPVAVVNCIMALVRWQWPLNTTLKCDDLGRSFTCLRWRFGPWRSSAMLFSIVLGRLSWCGIAASSGQACASLLRQTALTDSCLPSAVFSLYEIQFRVGYIGMTTGEAIAWHEQHRGWVTHSLLLLRACVNAVFYAQSLSCQPARFRLLDVTLDNLTLAQALAQITEKAVSHCRKIYFVNVNSLNLAFTNPAFHACLNRADSALVDGSGVRLAASFQQIVLCANVNGTDLLPHLCERFSQSGAKVFFLGAAPGVAAAAARTLCHRYPRLQIAGVQHGYFSAQDNAAIVKAINASGADFVFVALGSPIQEEWIDQHAQCLKARAAIAVGGLFDFYSGRLPRAPRWMCELGLEWVYRLWQEPCAKFRRYVIGNPVFLWRAWRQR